MTYRLLTIASVLLWLLALEICAQSVNTSVGPREPEFREDLELYQGRQIDTIVIRARNIFDTRSERYNNFVFRLANRIHIVTRESIIREELLLYSGGTFDAELARETVRNLRSRFAIYNAWWSIEETPEGELNLTLITVDQWSLTGEISVESGGGDSDIEFGIEERNFLGRHQVVSFDYVRQADDDNFVRAGFFDRRVWGQPVSLELDYNDDPANQLRSIAIARPYYNLSQNLALAFQYVDRSVRRDVYNDNGLLAARSWSEGEIARSEIRYRWGGYKRKVGLAGTHEYRYEQTLRSEVFPGADLENVTFPRDTLVHQLQGRVFIENLDFTTATRINGFDQIEDITLGQQAGIRLGRAFIPSFEDYDYDFAGFDVRWVHNVHSTFLFADYERIFWFRREADIRRTSTISLRAYNNYLDFVTFAGRILYRRDWRADQSAPLLLGGGTGLRGFENRFRTGDQVMVLNLESRFFPDLEVLSVLIGGVAFADAGRAFKPDEDFSLNDYFSSIGVGLRLSLEKASQAKILRIDLSLDNDQKLTVSFGTGQYF